MTSRGPSTDATEPIADRWRCRGRRPVRIRRPASTRNGRGCRSCTVYAITDAGRDEFACLLREAWAKVEPQPFAFDIALTFVEALPTEEVKHYLRERVMQLENAVRILDRREEEACQEEGGRRPLTGALFDHQRFHLEAELNWTRQVLEMVERGAFGAAMENTPGETADRGEARDSPG